MQVLLSHTIPLITGYYLVQCADNANPHLVLVIIEENKKIQIISEGKPLYFHDFPVQFLWSEIINIK